MTTAWSQTDFQLHLLNQLRKRQKVPFFFFFWTCNAVVIFFGVAWYQQDLFKIRKNKNKQFVKFL